ncbi:hypothetical protein GGX14DRAFT_621495 [Mycena pura]|uniref:Uncharacterized protein n=1 Tax=Mycena pura TaxID=153505 RepID=A0AAD6VJN9_9AGAR|nr:hypothetical protein GGX14DRAFT_621495 [Mycena pura]
MCGLVVSSMVKLQEEMKARVGPWLECLASSVQSLLTVCPDGIVIHEQSHGHALDRWTDELWVLALRRNGRGLGRFPCHDDPQLLGLRDGRVGFQGIRNYLYSLNDTINPSTYKTLDRSGYFGVHRRGVGGDAVGSGAEPHRQARLHGQPVPPTPFSNWVLEGDFNLGQEAPRAEVWELAHCPARAELRRVER